MDSCIVRCDRRRNEGFGDKAPHDEADGNRLDLHISLVEGDEIGRGNQVAENGKEFAG